MLRPGNERKQMTMKPSGMIPTHIYEDIREGLISKRYVDVGIYSTPFGTDGIIVSTGTTRKKVWSFSEETSDEDVDELMDQLVDEVNKKFEPPGDDNLNLPEGKDKKEREE